MNRHTQIRQAVLARLREQCGDSATFFDGLPALSGLIDTLIPLGFNYQRDNEMATWAMAEITYQITYTN
ncbi:hypothetical protein HVX39_19535 [Escherichia coli]|nr:hypothetical protein HVX39_19535 [Escherichia coli]